LTIHSTVAAPKRSSFVIAGNAAMIAVLFSPTDSIVRQLAINTRRGLRKPDRIMLTRKPR